MKVNTEQEWQFRATQLDDVRQWLAAQPSVPTERHLIPRPTLELQDVYYDSADWMIFRAGFALRLRRERGDAATGDLTEVTLKSLNKPRGGIARRKELSQRVDTSDIAAVIASDAAIAERVRELIGTRPLAPLFMAHTRRERQHLLEADTRLPLAEVDLDETSIEAPSGATCQLKRVEVECINATPEALEPFVQQLRDAAQLRPVEQSKFCAGLAAAGLDPGGPPELPAANITASQPFADTQFALLRTYFGALVAQEALVRADSMAAVHEMRVVARHLDVLLRVSTGYGPRWAVSSRGLLRALIDALGAVRDCDMQLAYLHDSAPVLEPADRDALEPLRRRLLQQRAKMRARLLRLLDSSRSRGWFENWREQLRADISSGARARRAVTAEVAREIIGEQARKLRKRADRLKDDSSADDYHAARIRAKRLRYALDAFAGLYGDAARDYSRALARLQRVLGDFNDAAVRSEKFARLVTEGRRVPASTSFVVGRLVELDRRAFDRCRRKFAKAYRRTQGRRWRALQQEMRQQAEAVMSATIAPARS